MQLLGSYPASSENGHVHSVFKSQCLVCHEILCHLCNADHFQRHEKEASQLSSTNEQSRMFGGAGVAVEGIRYFKSDFREGNNNLGFLNSISESQNLLQEASLNNQYLQDFE
jgi:hypothetical protein